MYIIFYLYHEKIFQFNFNLKQFFHYRNHHQKIITNAYEYNNFENPN